MCQTNPPKPAKRARNLPKLPSRYNRARSWCICSSGTVKLVKLVESLLGAFGANGWCKVCQPVWIGLVAKPTIILAQQWCKACTQTRHSRKVHRPVHWHMYTPSEAGSWQVNPDVMCHCQLTIRVDNIYNQTRLDLMNSHKKNATCAARRKVHRDACFEL